MSKDYQLKVNTISLGETFLAINANKLKDVKEMIIEKVDKNEKVSDSVTFEKEFLPSVLSEIFNEGVSEYKSIKIYYIEHNLKQYLTEIEIF